MTPAFAPPDGAVPLELVPRDEAEARLGRLEAPHAAWARAHGFSGALGELLCLPGPDGRPCRVLVGWGDAAARARGRFHLAAAAEKLPEGVYALPDGLPPEEAEEAALGWLLQGYRFGRYKSQRPAAARLAAPAGVDAAAIESVAQAVFLTRDLINTPARDMGPDALEAAIRGLAAAFGAKLRVVTGAELAQGFPMIAAVGAAAARPPRLIDLTWGPGDAPKVTLVGKGVCFDTGGLDLKPPQAMALMKKDMGGAATAIGLARMVMAAGLPLRLRLLVPAVENSVSAASFRPGDILTSRKGLTVEVNNTDAEGRLVLADALALAAEESPALCVSMATLTGAARVALGPDLPPFFTDDETLAAALADAARRVRDPLWRLPFWDPYEPDIEPAIADLDNAPQGGMAGAITAALFLRRFAPAPFIHLDLYAWTPKPLPGRPKGGECQGARALFRLLQDRHGG
ncbi:MAG: leucyl aminopeptidase [Paracoccaceae bacterium]|nr:MAG: leucyl aminopeptidase [Paracoccaceae bacterium]